MTSSYKIAFVAATLLSVMLVGYYLFNRGQAMAQQTSLTPVPLRQTQAPDKGPTSPPPASQNPKPKPAPQTSPDEPVAGTITLDGSNGTRTATGGGDDPAPHGDEPKQREYVIQRGDTIQSIAVTHYGSDRYWEDISHANPFIEMAALNRHVGETIRLPDVTQQHASSGLPAPDEERIHTVASGDKLWTIARQYYPDANAWRWIYNRNRDVIGDDPSKLKIGMKLIIPPAPPSSSN